MTRDEYCCRERAEGIQVCSLAENRSSADQSEEGCSYSKRGCVRSGGLLQFGIDVFRAAQICAL